MRVAPFFLRPLCCGRQPQRGCRKCWSGGAFKRHSSGDCSMLLVSGMIVPSATSRCAHCRISSTIMPSAGRTRASAVIAPCVAMRMGCHGQARQPATVCSRRAVKACAKGLAHRVQYRGGKQEVLKPSPSFFSGQTPWNRSRRRCRMLQQCCQYHQRDRIAILHVVLTLWWLCSSCYDWRMLGFRLRLCSSSRASTSTETTA